MKRLIVILIVTATVISCGNHKRRAIDSGAVIDRKDRVTEVYNGTYKGTLPCADCDGIEVTLKLKESGEYILKTKHIMDRQGMDDIHVEYNGWYSWNGDANTIKLHDINTQPDKYLYENGNLIQLDMNGNRITGPLADKYVLRK